MPHKQRIPTCYCRQGTILRLILNSVSEFHRLTEEYERLIAPLKDD